MKKYIIFCAGVVSLTGCMATMGPQKLQTSDTRDCAKNFTYNGSFFTGRTFKTNDFVRGVSISTALKRAARYTINDGWSITNTDKEMGIISASQGVTFGSGQAVPLNIAIDDRKNGVNVSMTFSISGGVTSPVEAVKDHFCSTIEAVAKK